MLEVERVVIRGKYGSTMVTPGGAYGLHVVDIVLSFGEYGGDALGLCGM